MKLIATKQSENKYKVKFANYDKGEGYETIIGAINENTSKAQFVNNLYRSYVNDFLTLDKFAEYYRLTTDDANELIDTARKAMK